MLTVIVGFIVYVTLALTVLTSLNSLEKENAMPPLMRDVLGQQTSPSYNTRVLLLAIFWPVYIVIMIADILTKQKHV